MTRNTQSIVKWDGGFIEFDAVETEDLEFQAAITAYPIELGASMTDYMRVEPVRLRMTGVASNSPVRAGIRQQMDGLQPVTNGVILPIRTPILPAANAAMLPTSIAGIPLVRTKAVRPEVRFYGGPAATVSRAWNVLAALTELQRGSLLLTVATAANDYTNMLLRRFSYQRSAQWAQALRFDMEFQQVVLATALQLAVLPPAKPKQARSKAPKDQGVNQSLPADASTEDIALQSVEGAYSVQ